MAGTPPEIDTRTYFSETDGSTFCSRCGADCSCYTSDGPAPSTPRATMSREVIIGHEGFPCPSTRGESSCADAWQNWRQRAGVQLLRA